MAIYRSLGKRALDCAVSLLLLVFLAPLLVFLGLAIAASLGRPVLFRQVRPGLRGRRFVLYKFRTMRGRPREEGPALDDEIRMTSLGCLLRRTSLDEIPELFNVLKGDMSLVGPRPLLGKYLPLYSAEQARRHDVRPGLTGWAQINGRNAISWKKKFELDVWYVQNYDLAVDVKILAGTVDRILRNEGISYPGCATAIEFNGHN